MIPAPFFARYFPTAHRLAQFPKSWSRELLQELLAVWRSLSRAEQASFLAAFFVGVLLRANHYGRPMLHDEAFAYEVFVKPGIMHTLFRFDYPQHILHSLLVYCTTLISGSEAFIRLPAFVFSLASLPLLFLFARRFFGVTAALFALSLSALSYYQVDYAHNARGYSMNVFFTLLSAYGLFSVIRDPSGKTAKYWLMYAIGAVLNVYTVVSSALYLVSAAAFGLPYLFSLGYRERRVLLRDCVKYNAIVIGATFLLYTPALAFFCFYPERVMVLSAGGGPKVPLSECLSFIKHMLPYLFSPFAEGSGWARVVDARFMAQTVIMNNWASVRFWMLACLSGFTAIGVLLTALKDKARGMLLASIIFTPFIFILLARKTIMYDRNLLYIQPFIFISIGVLLAQIQAFLKSGLPPAAVTAGIMSLIALAGFRTTYAEFVTAPDLAPKITASVLNKAIRPGDAYFPCYGIDNHIRYYLSDGSKDVYMLMFEYKRNGLLNARLRNGLQNIYCVFDVEPDFEKIFRIYDIDREILRRNYKPFRLYFQSGTVKVYLAERRAPPAARPGNRPG